VVVFSKVVGGRTRTQNIRYIAAQKIQFHNAAPRHRATHAVREARDRVFAELDGASGADRRRHGRSG
jgi:hypothetical protein